MRLVSVFGAGCSDTFQVTFYGGWVYFWTVSIEIAPQDVVYRIILVLCPVSGFKTMHIH